MLAHNTQTEIKESAPAPQLESKEPGYSYIYTPVSSELKDCAHILIEQIRDLDEWYVISHEKNAFSLVNDVKRGILWGGRDYRSSSNEEILQAIKALISFDTPASDADVLKLNHHHNQSLMSFPLTALSNVLPGLENYEPLARYHNFYRRGSNLVCRTEYTGFKMVEIDNPLQPHLLPGSIMIEFIWNPAKGFRFSQLGFSNTFMRDLMLKPRKNVFSEAELQAKIQAAYDEETALFKLQYPKSARVLLIQELQKLRQSKSINLEDETQASLFYRAFSMIVASTKNSELQQDEKFCLEFAELASELAYLCPQAENLTTLMMPLKTQAQFAFLGLTRTLENMSQADAQDALVRDFPKRLSQLEKYRTREAILLIQEIWQINRLVNTQDEAKYQELQEKYLVLRNKISQRQWGKIVTGGSAVIGGASLVALCFSGVGATIPALVWLSHLAATKITAGGLLAVGARFFGSGVKKRYDTQKGTHQVLNTLKNNEEDNNNATLSSLNANTGYRTSIEDLPNLTWSLAYSPLQSEEKETKEEPEITNATIQDWQDRQILNLESEDNGEAAVEDFKRNSLINGERCAEATCQQFLQNLAANASAYANDEEKSLLIKWINRYGGQEGAYYLVPMMIANGHFQGDTAGSYRIGKNNLIQPNWTVENGKISCSYDLVVKSLIHTKPNGQSKFITLGPDGSTIESDEPPEAQQELNPILRVRVKLRLDVQELRVTPKVTLLEVASYTHDLVPSDELMQNMSFDVT